MMMLLKLQLKIYKILTLLNYKLSNSIQLIYNKVSESQ